MTITQIGKVRIGSEWRVYLWWAPERPRRFVVDEFDFTSKMGRHRARGRLSHVNQRHAEIDGGILHSELLSDMESGARGIELIREATIQIPKPPESGVRLAEEPWRAKIELPVGVTETMVERYVMDGMSRGWSARQIADDKGLALPIVEEYIRRIIHGRAG